MRPRTLILTAHEDDEYGGVGLLPEKVSHKPGMNPAQSGVLLAHDIIEHVNGLHAIGSVEDELEAMGAIWWTRGQHWDIARGPYANMHPPQHHMAGDLSRMFGEWCDGDQPVRPMRTKVCTADSDLWDCLALAHKDAKSEWDHEARDGEFLGLWSEYRDLALARMRTGYRKARRMYGGDANELFWDIAEAAERRCKFAEVGQKFELTYGHDRNGRTFACIEEHYPEGY